jgi:predicted 3-demethylubiquinone-9 3-methyltransferase (glyoxalase superfamily)
MRTITPCLWFDGKAEEAATFYTSLLPDSHIDKVHRAPGNYPSGRAGDVLTVEFTLMGRPFVGLNGGPHFKFNEALSFQIPVDTQAEVERLTNALSAVPRPNNAAGSRIATACPGKSCRASFRLFSVTPIRCARSGPSSR